MDRREFLITSSGAAVAAASPMAASAEAAQAQPSATTGGGTAFKLAMPWPDAPQGPADSVRRLARRIEAMTGGRCPIEVVSARTDDADLTHGSAHDFAHLHPAFAYFAGLPGPMGLAPADLAHWMTVGGGQMLWDDLAGQHGWKSLLVGHTGDAPPLWSRAPIAGLADLAGLRIAVPGLGADVARALGAEANALAPAGVGAGLETGSVQAAEAGGLLASLANGIPRVALHATGSGLNGRGTALSLNIRLSAWDRLTDGDRAILEAAAAEEFQNSLAEARAHDQLLRRVMESSFGVTFVPWPAEVADALERVAEATIAHVAGHDALAARIDQSYMAFRAALSGTTAPRRATVTPMA